MAETITAISNLARVTATVDQSLQGRCPFTAEGCASLTNDSAEVLLLVCEDFSDVLLPCTQVRPIYHILQVSNN